MFVHVNQRGLETAQRMMDGLRIYYNFMRPHMTLDGKTPAQKAKIVSYSKKENWASLIKKATNPKRTSTTIRFVY